MWTWSRRQREAVLSRCWEEPTKEEGTFPKCWHTISKTVAHTLRDPPGPQEPHLWRLSHVKKLGTTTHSTFPETPTATGFVGNLQRMQKGSGNIRTEIHVLVPEQREHGIATIDERCLATTGKELLSLPCGSLRERKGGCLSPFLSLPFSIECGNRANIDQAVAHHAK